jgi:hypothetical protein
VSAAVFLAGGALLVSTFVFASQAFGVQFQVAYSEIYRLHKSIAFRDPTLDYGMFFGFRRLSLIRVLRNGIMGTVLPTSAQVAAGFKVSELLRFEGLGWLWLVFVLVAFSINWAGGSMYWNILPLRLRAYGQPDESINRTPIRIVGQVCFLLGVVLGYFIAKVLGSS